MVHAGCVFVASIHPSRTWMSGSFESVWWNACVHRLDLGLYSHPKEFLGNGVSTHAHSKGKIPSTGKILRGGWNQRCCMKQDSKPNILPMSYSIPISCSIWFVQRIDFGVNTEQQNEPFFSAVLHVGFTLDIFRYVWLLPLYPCFSFCLLRWAPKQEDFPGWLHLDQVQVPGSVYWGSHDWPSCHLCHWSWRRVQHLLPQWIWQVHPLCLTSGSKFVLFYCLYRNIFLFMSRCCERLWISSAATMKARVQVMWMNGVDRRV